MMGFGTGSKGKPVHSSLMLKSACQFCDEEACEAYQQRTLLSIFEAVC